MSAFAKMWLAGCVAIACRSSSKTQTVDDKPVVALDATEEPAALRKAKALFGNVPASFGPALDGVALGMSEAELGDKIVRVRTDYEATGTQLSRPPGQPLHELEITTRDICQELLEHLWRAWGDGTTVDDRAYWVHPSAPIRASYRRRQAREELGNKACDVRFDWYVTPEHWIEAPDAVVPTTAIGKPVSELRARLEARPTAVPQPIENGVLFWIDAGVGLGSERTKLWAKISRGRVASIEARTTVVPETWAAIEAHLIATHGQPSPTDPARWKSKPPIYVDLPAQPRLDVSVGAPPE